MRPTDSFFNLAAPVFSIIAGTFFLNIGWADFGLAFFVIFPVAVGFAIGWRTPDAADRASAKLLVCLVVSFIFLVLTGLEGVVCAFMALPIFWFLMWLGQFFALRIRRKNDEKLNDNDHFLDNHFVHALPLVVLFIANFFEKKWADAPAIVEIETTVELPFSVEKVFEKVKSMEKMDGEEPFLLQIGLPKPIRCELKQDSVGAERVCFFPNGEIRARVEEFEKPRRMALRVTDYSLTGRHWFRFENASYDLSPLGENRTRIIRKTIYRSLLRPRFYWQPLEKWGIESEHLFVLSSLLKNLKAAELTDVTR